jgi:reticulon-4-interacting protein 1, mitochondrial
LSPTFDATHNFAAWDDDLRLSALCATVRSAMPPLCIRCSQISTLDWVRGVLKTLTDKRRHRAALPKNGRYAWTVFKPETPALQELRELVEQRRVGLPIAVRESLAEAAKAFDHVKKGRRGRALILPGPLDTEASPAHPCNREVHAEASIVPAHPGE